MGLCIIYLTYAAHIYRLESCIGALHCASNGIAYAAEHDEANADEIYNLLTIQDAFAESKAGLEEFLG